MLDYVTVNAQGDIDPAVREALLCIIQSKKAEHSEVF